jgi:hypothetical protein
LDCTIVVAIPRLKIEAPAKLTEASGVEVAEKTLFDSAVFSLWVR